MRLKTGDQVVVIAGNDKGMRGRILHIDRAQGRVVVEGVNLRIKHLRRTPTHPEGGRVEREMPIHVSNVLLWSEKAGKGVRVRIEQSGGRKVRVGIPCGTKFD